MRRIRWLIAGGVASAGLLAVISLSRAADPSTLWHIVDDRCVPHEEQAHNPAPCAEVDLSHGREQGYVVLKDINGATQFLLMPTARIHGMESPEILAPETPNYWDLAWRARSFTEERLKHPLPRQDVSLAVNSALGRTQDQLHIHIDCVAPEVKAAIAAHIDDIGPEWAPFPVKLSGHEYQAMGIEQAELGHKDPFRLLADSSPAVAADMAHYTLVLVGAVFPGDVPGFVLLADHANLAVGNRASGEELQDHSCEVGNRS
jgi:CDP-diacylglycerol pyrophosphatase